MSTSEVKVNDKELAVLRIIAEDYDDVDWRAWYMRGIAKELKVEIPQVRRALRSLARKGLAAYERGLFDEDGQVAGSGYRCTKAGFELVEKLNPGEQPPLL